jgi:hypothetical protein
LWESQRQLKSLIPHTVLNSLDRIQSPTIAVFKEDDRHVTHAIPTGSIVVIDPETFNGNKLVNVMWAEKEVMMFAQDVRSRGERLEEISDWLQFEGTVLGQKVRTT